MEEGDVEMNFIRRPAIVMSGVADGSSGGESVDGGGDSDLSPSRPVTPPNDQSLKLNKSLGLMLSPQSPPYRKVRSMKLIESPRPFIKSRFDLPFTSTPTPSPGGPRTETPRARTAPLRMQRSRLGLSGARELMSLSQSISSPQDAVNPFTTTTTTTSSTSISDSRNTSKRPSKRSQKRISFDGLVDEDALEGSADTSDELEIKRERPRLSDFNTPRYQQEFYELEVIGVGVHGFVYKCLNIINGIVYAVKRGRKPTANERSAHNEIYAHAALEHPFIVRNYSNWTENGHVFMQNEYCNGGSLEEEITKVTMDEKHLRRILENVCQGLRYIHSRNMAHLDIKPGNIFIHRGPRLILRTHSDPDELSEDDETDTETVYKIGDLGHVTKLDEVNYLREGDCRYFPKEILQDDYSNLTKVDIFALGLTLYEAAGGGPLPKNGDEWHAVRDGKLKSFSRLSHEINALIKRMVHPNPDTRPSAEDILLQISSAPVYKSVKDKHELKAAKQKVQVLEQQLENVMKCFKQLADGKRPVGLNNNIYKGSPLNNNRGERLVEPVIHGLVALRRGGVRKSRKCLEKM